MDETIRTRLERPIPVNELRKFGVTVGSLILLFFSIIPLIRHGGSIRTVPVLLAMGLFTLALILPRQLLLVYRGWTLLGHYLGVLNIHIVLGVIYFLVLTPMGVMMRLLGKDPLGLRYSNEKGKTYLIPRSKRGSKHLDHPF